MSKIKNFPSLYEIRKIQEINLYRKLYDIEQYSALGLNETIKNQFKDEKSIIYIPNPLPYRISEFYSDFVAGETDRMTIKAGTGSDEDEKMIEEIVYENDIKEKLGDWALTQSKEGSFVLYAYLDEQGTVKIEECPLDQYFPQQDGSVIFATYKLDPADPDQKRLLLYTQHYTLIGVDVHIKREAFYTNAQNIAIATYPLEKMAEILGKTIVEDEVIAGLGDLPIRHIKNGSTSHSDYYPITPQLSEINERTTQMSIQFLKNLDAKLVLPAGMADADGKVKLFDTILVESKDDVEPKYLTNTNSLMTEAQEHIMTQIRLISIATGVPMFELLKSSTPESVESLKINLFSAIRRTNKKRAKIKRGLLDLIRIGFTLKNMTIEKDPIIKFSDVLPTDDYVQTETENIKIGAGLTSKKSAMMRLENYSEEEADEELERIQEEHALSGIADFSNNSFTNDNNGDANGGNNNQ